MKKVLVFLTLIVTLLLCLASCNHEHSFGEWSVTKNATCTEEGVKTRYCDCGEKQSDVIPATGHNYVDYVCTNCCDIHESPECKHENLDFLLAKDPTCTETGLTEGIICLTCEKRIIEQKIIDALGHDEYTYSEKDESCNVYNGIVCERNGCDYTECVFIGVVSHAFGDWERVNNVAGSPCGIDKIYMRTCADCGATEDRVEPTSDHDYMATVISIHSFDSVNDVATVGEIKYECQNDGCDSTYYEYENHEYTQIIIASTCTEQGHTLNTCSCGHSYKSDFAEKLPHTPGAEATCTIAQTCTKCLAMISPATGHIWGEWEESLYSSSYIGSPCEKETVQVRYCTECGVQDETTNTIPALGHDWKDATCTEPKICQREGCGLTDGESIGHSYCAMVTPPTAIDDGYNTYTCSNCGDSFTEIIIPIEFTVTKSNRTQIGYTGAEGEELTIPATFESNGAWYRVTSIGKDAFRDCTGLTSVVLPDSVTSIESRSFAYCASLESVILGENSKLVTIGDGAFLSSIELEMIIIPINISFIEAAAFQDCYSLKNIYYDGTIEQWNAIEKSTSGFQWDINTNTYIINCSDGTIAKNGTVIYYPTPSEGLEFTLNDDRESYSVTGIGTCGDAEIRIPRTYNNLPVTSIGANAFQGCSNLTSVVIPNKVTNIGDMAFYNCKSLKNLIVSDSVESIGYRAFDFCYSIQYNQYDNALYLGSDRNPYLVLVKTVNKSITSCKISNKTKLIYHPTFIALSDGWAISDGAFYDCTNLTEIIIPDSVTNIFAGSFWGCSSLKSVKIGDSVNGIDDFLFWQCTSLANVVIGDSVRTIGYSAFEGCSSLVSIVIPDSVISIGERAFVSCNALESVIFEEPEGWFAGGLDMSSAIENPNTAALYLTNTIFRYENWIRIE